MVEEKKNEKPKEDFELVEVPTQYGLAFRNNASEEILDSNQLLVLIANEVREIKRAVA